jgi:hypothetical protein
MSATVSGLAPRGSYGSVVALLIAHALLVLLVWVGWFYFNVGVVSARTWVTLCWLWLIWPMLLMLLPGRTARRVFVPLLIGIALLAPCLSTLWSFAVWTLGGFAT